MLTAFLAELAEIRRVALIDLEHNKSKVGAFRDYVHTSLQDMKRGIYNEFRRIVASNPQHRQYALQRTVTPTQTSHELIRGFRNTVGNTEHFQTLVTAIRAEFPDMTVNCRADEGCLRIIFTVFLAAAEPLL